MCSHGQFKGDDINDIKKHIDEIYGLNMPVAILKRLLNRIEQQINCDNENLKFYKDGSFFITDYTFDDFDEEINKKEKELCSQNTAHCSRTKE